MHHKFRVHGYKLAENANTLKVNEQNMNVNFHFDNLIDKWMKRKIEILNNSKFNNRTKAKLIAEANEKISQYEKEKSSFRRNKVKNQSKPNASLESISLSNINSSN